MESRVVLRTVCGYLRIEFLQGYRSDIPSLTHECIWFGRGGDELFIRGERVPKGLYRMMLVLEEDGFGPLCQRISSSCILIKVRDIQLAPEIVLLAEIPEEVLEVKVKKDNYMSSGIRGKSVSITITKPSDSAVSMSIMREESIRNGDTARFFDTYFQWISREIEGVCDRYSTNVYRSLVVSDCLVQFGRSSRGNRAIEDIRSFGLRLREVIRLYMSDERVPRTIYAGLISEIYENVYRCNEYDTRNRIRNSAQWELATIAIPSLRSEAPFNTINLKKWLLFEIQDGCDSAIGANLAVLTALHDEFRLSYVAKVINDLPGFEVVSRQIRSIYILGSHTVTPEEVGNLIEENGLEFCGDAIKLPFFAKTHTHFGLLRESETYRRINENTKNKGLVWAELGNYYTRAFRSFRDLSRDDFKFQAVWIMWKFLTSCLGTLGYDSEGIVDLPAMIEYSVSFAHQRFDPGERLRAHDSIFCVTGDRRVYDTAVVDENTPILTYKNKEMLERRGGIPHGRLVVPTDITDINISEAMKHFLER